MRLLNGKQGLRRSQFAKELKGSNLEKVLQKAMVFDYFGDVLEAPFAFMINQTGIALFIEKVETIRTQVQAEQVFIGLEATGHYYEDLVRILTDKGYSVHIINAASTHEERKQHLTYTKTDDIDLYLIAEVLIGNKATNSKLAKGSYREIQQLTRARRAEINKRSRIKMEIRTVHDHIWREYQGVSQLDNGKLKTQKIFSDFWGKSSLFILKNYPHAVQIAELGELGLRRLSKEQNLKLRTTTIEKLLRAADESVSRPIDELTSELFLLQQKLKDYEWHTKTIQSYEEEIERIFIQTDGRLLLTIPGIGLATAAEIYSEMGDLTHYTNAGQLIKKAGTNPVIKQSGQGTGHFGKISKQGNRYLREAVYTAGRCLAQHNIEFKPFYDRLKANGKHCRKIYIALGNKLLKVAFAMLKHQQPFHSPHLEINYQEEINKKLTKPLAA